MVKIIIGIAIIIASFAYILVNHDKSMMQNMMDKQSKKLKQLEQEEAEKSEINE